MSEQSPDKEEVSSRPPTERSSFLLKGWHSDLLLGLTVQQGGLTVQRRSVRTGDGGRASRRSWHEESSFEKQLKRRSCHMELGEGRGEEGGGRGGGGGFSGSMEVIQVS